MSHAMDERGNKVNVEDRAQLDEMEDNPKEEHNSTGIASHGDTRTTERGASYGRGLLAVLP